MHNAFQNKRRRFINFREATTNGVLPEHFAEYYPKFIALLERYYEFQDTNNSTELLSHLFASRDINETDLTLLTFIEDELLLGEAYFEGFGNTDVELRAAANFSNILFRSKGSKFAIEWFFRSFYGEDVEVIYPKENIFKVGDADSQLGANSLRYLTDDKLYQTFALLIRVGIPISKWKEVFKLFTHPAGMYLGGEVFLVNEVEVGVKTLNDNILQYTTPTYSMTPDTQSVNEGQSIVMNVTGTNVRNDGTDALFYYFGDKIVGDSVEAEDFESGYGLPDSNSPKYLEINNSVGTISITTVIDELVESTETVNVILTDADGRKLDSAEANIQDVLSTYTLTLDSSRPNRATDIIFEGDTATFNIVGTNTAFGGNVDLNYYVDLITDSDFGEAGRGKINASDITAGYPTEGSPATVSLVNSQGSFTIPTLINTSLVDLLDFSAAVPPTDCTIGTTINLYNEADVQYTIPADTVISIPFKTLPFTDTNTTGEHVIPADVGRATPAGHNLTVWISTDPGGSTNTEATSVISASDPTQELVLTWKHGASTTGVQGLQPSTVYYQNHAVIANTADYTNWTSAANLFDTSYDYNTASTDKVTLLDSSVEPDDIGLGALERLVVKLKSPTTGQQKGIGVAYLEGIAPEFNISGATQVVEGDDFTFNVQILAENLGDTFTWEILDDDFTALTDTRVPTNTGTFTASSVGAFPITISTQFSPQINGASTGSLASAGGVQRTFHDARIRVTNQNTSQIATAAIGIFDGPAVYTMVPSEAPGLRGDSAAFLISGSNITDLETWFYVGLGETTLADYDSDVPQDGSRQRIDLSTQDANGFYIGKVDEVNTPLIGAPTYGDRPRLKFDPSGSGIERLELYLYDEQTLGDKLAEINYTIGSLVTFTGATTLNETTNATETYDITGLGDGTYNYYYVGAEIDQGLTFGGGSGSTAYDINADDFESTFYSQGSTGTLTIASGTGQIPLEIKDDKVREGDEKFQIVITDSLGFIVGTSPEITIEDTSVPTYTIAAYDQLNSTAGGAITTIDEDDNLNLLITADSRMTETLYVELIDVDAGATTLFDNTQLTIDAVDGQNWLQFTLSGDDGTAQGDRDFKVILWEQGFPVTEGSALAELTVTLTDPTEVSWNLAVDDDTPNENQLLTFTISGSNIPDGTYYYALEEMATAFVTSSSSGTIVPADPTTGRGTISLFMEESVLSGGVSNISSNPNGGNNYLMTISNTVFSGQWLHFMPQPYYDYFSPKTSPIGTVSVSNNSGTFQVQLDEASELSDRAFTMAIYKGLGVPNPPAEQLDGEAYVRRQFTVQNTTSGLPVNFTINDLFFDDLDLIVFTGGSAVSFAEIKFKTDGKIYRTGTGAGEPSQTGEYVADNGLARWLNGTATSGQYEVFFSAVSGTQVPNIPFVVDGNLGVWTDINTAEDAYLSLYVASSSNANNQLEFNVTIREKANPSNIATKTFASISNGGTGGGLFVSVFDTSPDDGNPGALE